MKKFVILLFAGMLGLLYWTFSGVEVVAPGPEAATEPVILETVLETQTRVPIIMYHYVREVNKAADPLGWNLSVTPDLFVQQMDWLKDNAYVTLHLSDLIDGKVPENAVILTFDDGLEDFYTTALPILKEHGFTASNSIITGMIGAHEHMTEDQVRAVIDAGVEITSHTVGHVNMASAGEAEVRRQLVESRDYLESVFGVEVVGFVYPSGKYNKLVVRVLGEEGYKVAVTTEYGEADLAGGDLLLLPRVRIDNRDGFDGFVKKIEAL